MPLDERSEQTGCALCAAWIGAGKSVEDYWQSRYHKNNINVFADGLGFSVELAKQISTKHCVTPRLAIADWLDTLDVAKPADAQTFERFMQSALAPVELDPQPSA